ncbi:hypothetical protein AWB74_02141 [Caballeronia arvi]|uniref:Uncharacterized protein n=1 Tax=Caballeronia arvi TaxID=1777135 RepID=A0A158HT24_9BURK|nr:hypothetical protein [Caballeronia arvi]SAL47524.1 hypothetical protein AWB74_02141 [Caballeronia arvi]
MRYEDHPPHTEGDGLRAVADALDKLRDEIGQRHTENTSSLEVLEKDLKVVIERVDDLAKGFPGGDADGHRRAHEALIQRAEARARFYEDLRGELAKKGLWALLALLGVALWQYFKTKVMT